MDEQAVDGLQRDLRQVLVRPVDRVPRLEADDALPAALGELGPGVGRVERQLGEGGLGSLEHGHAAGEVVRVLAVEARDARVLFLGGAEAELGLAALVVVVDLLDVDHAHCAAALVGQRDAVACGRAGDCETDRQRPGQAAREVHLLEHPLVVLLGHEPFERRERARGEHVQVGQLPRAEAHAVEAGDVLRLARAVDEPPAVRRDQVFRRDRAHSVSSEVPSGRLVVSDGHAGKARTS